MGIFNFLYHAWENSTEKELFFNICQANDLKLDYETNKDSLLILKEIFISRVYADYFPFYEKVSVMDLGAHKGYFSIFSAKNTHPDSRIIALEPAEDNFNDLNLNLKANKIENVEVLKAGVFSETKKTNFYLSKSENHSIFNNYSEYLGTPPTEPPVEIFVLSLKDLLEKFGINELDFLKVDCEGAEYPFIFSADKQVLAKIKTISLEFHDLKNKEYTGLKLANHLENNGFKIVKFSYEPTTINNNFGKLIAVRM